MEGQKFDSVDEVNAQLAALTAGGRLSERASAWKRDDPKWRAQELAYDALETDDLVEALRLIHEALKLDPDRTDAQRLMVPLEAPEYYTPGGESEAQVCAKELSVAWQNHPGFREWLRARR